MLCYFLGHKWRWEYEDSHGECVRCSAWDSGPFESENIAVDFLYGNGYGDTNYGSPKYDLELEPALIELINSENINGVVRGGPNHGITYLEVAKKRLILAMGRNRRDEVEFLARKMWEERGKPKEKDKEIWFDAEDIVGELNMWIKLHDKGIM